MQVLFSTLRRWKSDYAAPSGRTGELFRYNLEEFQTQTDRLFYYLLLSQYPAAITLAWSSTKPFNLWLAIIFGGIITGLPVWLIRTNPNTVLTRHAIAIAQMLMGSLLIHLTGGRIETHFHFFGSLAFLAFYRDAWVLGTATLVVIADNLVRGMLIPESIYGGGAAGGWRILEHTFWIAFENLFLLIACAQSRVQLSTLAADQAQLERLNGKVENAVRIRTRELSQKTKELSAARDAAMETTRLKSQFLANVSHEIRTPMNGVLGMTSLLLDSHLTPEQRDCALTVQRSAESLLIVINDILDFSKIEAGKLSLEHLDFNLVNEIEDTLALVAEAAASKRLELISDLDPGIPSVVSGDPGRLRQILVNLVANAIKFTAAGEVKLRVTQIQRQEDRARLRFEVTDTGIGIPKEAGRKLFNAFVQVDGTTTRKFEGTGLGLAISKQLVELMNGQIGFDSTPGAGTTFWFEIVAGVVTEDNPIPSPLAGLRALVVDDNSSNRIALVRMMEAWGMSVEQAPGAAEAFELLKHNEIHVVLSDLHMPGMDGQEFARALRRRPRFESLPLLMLTSIAQRSVTDEVSITKPVRRQQLFRSLAHLCGKVAPAEASADPLALVPLARSLKILVAEDNPVNQRVIKRMLDRLGQRCDLVGDGQEAIAAVQRTHYDLVLMDCQMPRVDGFEATAAIRSLSGPPGQIPIIAVTANAMNGTRERCLAAGMTGHIAKPIRLTDLAELLRTAQSELTPAG